MRTRCRHEPRAVAGIQVTACADCGLVEWWGEHRPLDPAEGMARLFGQYDLVGTLPALGSPATEVLAYRPPSRRARAGLSAFPAGVWLEAAPDLWLSHDGDLLLLAPTDPLLAANLQR